MGRFFLMSAVFFAWASVWSGKLEGIEIISISDEYITWKNSLGSEDSSAVMKKLFTLIETHRSNLINKTSAESDLQKELLFSYNYLREQSGLSTALRFEDIDREWLFDDTSVKLISVCFLSVLFAMLAVSLYCYVF